MTFVVRRIYKRRGPSILDLAFAGLRADERKAAKGAKAEVAHPKDGLVRSEPYLRLVAARACKNCGRRGPSQAAHLPPVGKSIKQDDRETFPLCADGPRRRGCHTRFDQYELMPRAEAMKQGKRWAAETRAEIAAEGKWPKKLQPWPADTKGSSKK